MKSLLAALALAAFTLPALADAPQGEPAITENPAYLDFSTLDAEYGEPRVMVNLSATLLRLASAIPQDDPAAAETLRNLDAVRVHVYDTHGNPGPATERMQRVAESLGAAQWDNIVRVRDEGEFVDVYLKQNGERILGLTVMAVDGEETVFVNVLGDIDPAQLQAVVDGVDLDFDLSFADVEIQ